MCFECLGVCFGCFVSVRDVKWYAEIDLPSGSPCISNHQHVTRFSNSPPIHVMLTPRSVI